MTTLLLGRSGRAALACALCAVVATGASAQTTDESAPPADRPSLALTDVSPAWQRVDFGQPLRPQPRGRSLIGDIAGDFGRFFSTKDTALILAVGLGSSLSSKSLDRPLAGSAFNTEIGPGDGGSVDTIFEAGGVLGDTTLQVGAAFATYGLGKWLDKPGMAEFGRDLVRAQVLTQTVTHLMKQTVKRTRPDASNRSSFPSGHTSGAFATATVFQKHFGWKGGLPAYAVAGYIAASRISENKHYLSDVIFGAAIGLAAGRTVTFGVGGARFEVAPLAAPGGAGVHVTIGGR
jgi:membrane-associated phospholipid phosphatase